MKSTVMLKSFPNGISVILDENVAYEQLLEEIAVKFRDADKFLRDAKVAVSLEGRKLSPSQEMEILDIITDNSHLNVLCLKESERLEIPDNTDERPKESFGQFYRGSLKNGQSVETKDSIIIIGDVAKGCSVYSSKDIVVLGTLAGKAYAGASGNGSHFIAAFNMIPESLRIGDRSYSPKFTGLFRFGTKNTPMIASIYNGKICLKQITKELPGDFAL